ATEEQVVTEVQVVDLQEAAAPGEEQAALEQAVATERSVATEQAVTTEQAAATEQAVIEEQDVTAEPAAAVDQAEIVEQAVTGVWIEIGAQAAARGQPEAQDQVTTGERVVATEQAVTGEQVATGEQVVSEGQPAVQEHTGGEDEQAESAEVAVHGAPPDSEPGPGTPPDEQTTRQVMYRAEQEMDVDMQEQDTAPDAGPTGDATPPEEPVRKDTEAAAQPTVGQGEEASAAVTSPTEADLREADVLPWRDETPSLAALEPGTVLDGRYRVVELLRVDQSGMLYTARDLRRCPQCGFDENSPDQAFCASCGAVLDQKPLVRVLQHAPGQDPPAGVEVLDHVLEGEHAYWVLKEPGKQTDVLGGSEEPMRLEIGQRSHPGQTRALDEDSLFTLTVTRTFESIESASALFVVADGMGGHEAGEVASRIAIRALADAVLREVFARELAGAELSDEAIQAALEHAVQVANEQVFLERERRENDMGTTVTAALLRDWTLFIAHVGDCRAYRWGKDGLQQLTTDHSVIASMVASGAAQPEEVYTHPHRSVIYRSVGDQPSVEVDTAVLSAAPGDRLVLCCDGLWEMLRDEGIEDVLLREADPQRACDIMVEQANEAGGPDNISAIVVQL
ncbi:MAG: protein phosphatase 2C domain-containing protein, partial [Anaerolineae bacterium]